MKNTTINKQSVLMSLYDYFGKGVGKQLGRDVYEVCQRQIKYQWIHVQLKIQNMLVRLCFILKRFWIIIL